jgi:hypothetical protein
MTPRSLALTQEQPVSGNDAVRELEHLVLYVRDVVKVFNEIALYAGTRGVDGKSNPALITARMRPLVLHSRQTVHSF